LLNPCGWHNLSEPRGTVSDFSPGKVIVARGMGEDNGSSMHISGGEIARVATPVQIA
jgi:hypothetical protein